MKTASLVLIAMVIAVALTLALPHLHAAEPMLVGADGVGRYQVERVGDNLAVLVDTKTGRVWQRLISTNLRASQWEEITVDELAANAKRP